MECALFPIHKKFTEMIFSGKKDLEFRNVRTKLVPGDRIFVYETKRDGGKGMVTGYFTCGDIKEIPHHLIGTYPMIGHYAEKFGTEDEREHIKEALKVNLKHHDNCLILDYLFDDTAIRIMQETGEPPNSFEFHTGWEEIRQKATTFVYACDRWLKDIGYYNQMDESSWKWQIEIKNPVLLDEGIPINNLFLKTGKPMERAPQSFCYIQTPHINMTQQAMR